MCLKKIKDWQDGIYSSDNESWRWKGSLRGVLLSAMPPLCLVIGCFHPTTTDSPFQPGQLVKKRLSCLASLSALYRRQIFLIVKKCSAALQRLLCRGGIVYILLFHFHPLNASALAPVQAVLSMFNSAEGMKVFRIISLLLSEREGRRQDRKRVRGKGDR